MRDEKFYSSDGLPNNIRLLKSRRIKGAGQMAYLGEWKNAHNILVGKSEGKNLLGGTRHQ